MGSTLLFLPPTSIPVTGLYRQQKSRQIRIAQPRASLILGLNQYSHDASIAVIDQSTGRLLFAQSKERITRQKCDAGDLSVLIRHALRTVSAQPDDVSLVVANNHHFRIAPFEKRLPFTVSLGYQPKSYLCPFNLIGSASSVNPSATKVELSHHLAHAYSAVYAAPFDRGVVLIMDGMGDSLNDWLVGGAPATPAHNRSTIHDSRYYTEESICHDAHDFREFPVDVRSKPGASFREAETAYIFDKSDGRIEFTRIFKRWTEEIAPSELPNHSFEEMTSVGAMYSRISAILFKDWNACGKVMGLAPYAKQRSEVVSRPEGRHFIHGNLGDGTLNVSEGQLKGLEFVHKSISDCDNSAEGTALRRHFENLAFHIQEDLEDVVLSFVSNLMEWTGERNIVFAGGVALNSSVNGRLSVHPKVHRLYVPPFPGDEGISIGCALFGYSIFSVEPPRPYALANPFMPYLGKEYSRVDVMDAIQCLTPWIRWRSDESNEVAAQALSESKVVGLFSGKSEFGPRALGCRSILADPRNPSMLDHVNKVIKKREAFRPFAPTVLNQYASEWFYDCSAYSSPYMSLTKRAKKPDIVPAVVHVDGTSRLQTLAKEDNSNYHDLISRFHKITGVPMVMNTSFNVAGEPIVESPLDALLAFLNADGIDLLVFPGVVVEKEFVTSLDDQDLVSTACVSFRSEQVQDSEGNPLRTTVRYIPRNFLENELEDATDEISQEIIDGLQLSILELIHEVNSCTVSNVFLELGSPHHEEAKSSYSSEQNAPSRDDIRQRIADLCNRRLVQRKR